MRDNAQTHDDTLQPISLVLVLCVIALTMDLLLGPIVLRAMGISYATHGGNPITKLHPGTYVTLLAALIYICTIDHPLFALLRLARGSAGIFFCCVGMTLALGYVAMMREIGTVCVFIDTYVGSALMALMLVHAPRRYLRGLTTWMIALVIVNAIIGIVEARYHTRLLPYISDDHVAEEDYFRATALMGHPLRNATMTALGALAVMAMEWPLELQAVLLSVLGLGLLGFGGRSALVLAALGSVVIGIHQLNQKSRNNPALFVRDSLLAGLAAVCAAVGAGAIFLFTRFGERVIGEDLVGSSSESRLQLFKVFRTVDFDGWITGYSEDTIEAMASLVDLKGQIENFWVHMFLLLGMAGYILWLPGFLAGLGAIWRRSGFSARTMLVCFLILASSNTEFSKKTVHMSVAFAFMIGVGWCEWRPARKLAGTPLHSVSEVEGEAGIAPA